MEAFFMAIGMWVVAGVVAHYAYSVYRAYKDME
jgi:hypothetical protein